MSAKSIKKNAIYNGVKTVAAIVFPLITFPYISRVLQVENVGKINFGLSIVSYFSLIASLGINAYAIRECAMVRDDRNKLEKLASQIFSINILTTIIAYFLLGIFLFLYTKIYTYRKLIILQSLSIIFTTIGTDWINSALEDFKYITIRTVTMQIVSIILMFLLVKVPEDYIKYVIISLVASSGANIINIFYIRRFCKISFTFDFEFNKHIKSIFFMFVMILAQTIFNNVDMSMLGIMSGDKAVGIYSTAYKINNLISQLLTSLLWVIMPRLSYLYEKHDFKYINSLLSKILSFNIIIGFPCAVGAFLLAKDLIIIFAGHSYIDSAIVLRILMISFLVTLFGGSFLGNMLLLPFKREKFFMIVCVITAVFNVITNYFLIPRFGANGAAVTTAISSILMALLLLFRMDKRFKFDNMFWNIITSIFGCIAISFICASLNFSDILLFNTVIKIVLCIVLYFSLLIIFKNQFILEWIHILEFKLKKFLSYRGGVR